MKLLESQQTITTPDFSVSLENCSKEGVEIMPMDVLCGRGKNSFNHVGNRKFRDIVADAIPGYVTATSRATKSEIVTNIVRKVRESGGRFLKRDNDRKVWYVLNYTQSKEKAGHAIRDATITEDSKRQRAKKRKLMRAANSAARRASTPVVTPEKPTSTPVAEESQHAEAEAQEEAALVAQQAAVEAETAQTQYLLKDLTNDVKSLDDVVSPMECLSSMLMAHFPEKLFPEEVPCSTSFEPLPIDDPFNSYIDELVGPLIDIAELADF